MSLYGHRTRRIILMTMLGVLVFIPKILLPTPIDKVLFIFQALVLSLAAILLDKLGATYTAFVGGLLTTIIRPAFFPLTLIFAVIYGLMIDGLFILLKVKSPTGIKHRRLVLSTTLGTVIIGLIAYYLTVHVMSILPRSIVMEIIILVCGAIGGAVGAWLASILLKKGIQRYMNGYG